MYKNRQQARETGRGGSVLIVTKYRKIPGVKVKLTQKLSIKNQNIKIVLSKTFKNMNL